MANGKSGASPSEFWTEERVTFVTKSYLEGQSCSWIADRLPWPATRNSVIGKLHRIGITRKAGTARQLPTRPPLATLKAPKPEKPSAPKLWKAPKPEKIAPPPPVERPAPVLISSQPRSRQCKWPIGDPREADFRFCEAPAQGNYCEEHHAIAFTPRTVKSPRNGTELARALRKYL